MRRKSPKNEMYQRKIFKNIKKGYSAIENESEK